MTFETILFCLKLFISYPHVPPSHCLYPICLQYKYSCRTLKYTKAAGQNLWQNPVSSLPHTHTSGWQWKLLTSLLVSMQSGTTGQDTNFVYHVVKWVQRCRPSSSLLLAPCVDFVSFRLLIVSPVPCFRLCFVHPYVKLPRFLDFLFFLPFWCLVD